MKQEPLKVDCQEYPDGFKNWWDAGYWAVKNKVWPDCTIILKGDRYFIIPKQ